MTYRLRCKRRRRSELAGFGGHTNNIVNRENGHHLAAERAAKDREGVPPDHPRWLKRHRAWPRVSRTDANRYYDRTGSTAMWARWCMDREKR